MFKGIIVLSILLNSCVINNYCRIQSAVDSVNNRVAIVQCTVYLKEKKW